MVDEDLDDAVEAFLHGADAVLEEYNQGYMDADAAVSRLESHVEKLHEAYDDGAGT